MYILAYSIIAIVVFNLLKRDFFTDHTKHASKTSLDAMYSNEVEGIFWMSVFWLPMSVFLLCIGTIIGVAFILGLIQKLLDFILNPLFASFKNIKK